MSVVWFACASAVWSQAFAAATVPPGTLHVADSSLARSEHTSVIRRETATDGFVSVALDPHGVVSHVTLADRVQPQSSARRRTARRSSAVLMSQKLDLDAVPEKKSSASLSPSVETAEHMRLLCALAAVVLILDYAVFEVLAGGGASFGCHVGALIFWLLVGASYNLIVWRMYGRSSAVMWCTGYFLEWTLSFDNLLVFNCILAMYQTPLALQYKAMFLGFAGALLFRLILFCVLGSAIASFRWVRIICGLVLIMTGIGSVYNNSETDPEQFYVVRMLKGCLGSRFQERYDFNGFGFFCRDAEGRLCVTLLFLVVVCMEAADLVFAVDSITAKVIQIPDRYIAYSSSVVAMFGLRHAVFVLKDMVLQFELLEYGVCIVLVFIGIEAVMSDWVHVPMAVECAVIVSVFSVGILGSVVRSGRENANQPTNLTVNASDISGSVVRSGRENANQPTNSTGNATEISGDGGNLLAEPRGSSNNSDAVPLAPHNGDNPNTPP